MPSNELDPVGDMDARGNDYLNHQIGKMFGDACNQIFAGACDGVVTALAAEHTPLGTWYEVKFKFDETYKGAPEATVISIENAVADYTTTHGSRPSVMVLNFHPLWVNVLSSRLSRGMVRTNADHSMFLEMWVLCADTLPDQSAPANAFWLGNIDGSRAQFPNLIQPADRFSYLRNVVNRAIRSSIATKAKEG